MTGLAQWMSGIFSRGDAGIAVPAMDGVLKPNTGLEHAERIAAFADIDDVAPAEEGLFVSAGSSLYKLLLKLGQGKAEPVANFDGDIGFVTGLGENGLAVGVLGQGIHVGTPGKFASIELPDELSACMTAAAMMPSGELAISVGSTRNGAREWKRDLMERGKSGLVFMLNLETGEHRRVADGLAYPHGIALHKDGRLLVTEAWRHRVIALDAAAGGSTETLLDDLPAYPARLAPALDGGYWLALFAPRRQLFEFVLREHGFRRDMMESVPPDEWVAPALGASGHYDHPLQQGSVRQMGLLKPWAPSSSYGLVVKCDERMRPLKSWHSRADGHMHGVTAVVETDLGVYAASKGADAVLMLQSVREPVQNGRQN